MLLAVKRLYGLTVLAAVGTSFTMIFLGFSVGKARKAAIEDATASGDEHATERFSYPKMYAEGFSEAAKKFNCVQRGHQHALETYTQMLGLTLLGGLSQPIVSTAAAVLWMAARTSWAEGYASGDPKERYTPRLAFHIWTTLLLQSFTAGATGLMLLGVDTAVVDGVRKLVKQ